MDGAHTEKARAAEAARHRRLFELLNQGQLQANRLGPQDAALPPPGMEDFAEMARRSLASASPAPKPPRRRFWLR
ncbi:hypothetical protein [Pseudooceanicola sp.]|uniref:hypothetical protein n=1 Tax=Pseudooceanicola sp. TaxID=1914328 RepID=UPI004058D397